MGREVNPFIGRCNVKIILMRFNVSFWVSVVMYQFKEKQQLLIHICVMNEQALIDIALVATQIERNGSATPTLLLSAFGHLLLMLDHVAFEVSFAVWDLLKSLYE